MLFQKIGRVALCLLIALFVIGCEQMNIMNGTGNGNGDDDSVSVTPGDVPDDDTKLVGNVVILTGDDDVDDIDQYGGDVFDFNSATIEGDTLTVAVSYGGGCETHTFTLLAEPEFDTEFPGGPAIGFSIAHNANGDMCQRWVEESYHFDLTPIKQKYQAEHAAAGAIRLLIAADPTVTFSQGAPPTDLTYSFSE